MAKLLKTKLYGFQRRAAKFALKYVRVALFMAQGVGKTITILFIAARLWRKHGAVTLLVVAPKAVLIGWARQALRHLNIPFRTYVGKGGVEQAERDILQVFNGITILAVNYELLWRRQWILDWEWDIATSDESHRIKKHNATQSLAMADIKAVYRFALTGTPTDGDEMQLWSQFRFIDPTLLGDNWWEFVNRFCRKIKFGDTGQFKWKLKPAKKKKMLRILGKRTFRVKHEVLGLPPVTHSEVYFKLTGKAKKAYREMEESYYTEWKSREATSELAITSMLRLQQLTGGHLQLDEGDMVRLEQDKLVALLDILEDIPKKKKIVIFVKFIDEIHILKEAMEKTGRSVETLYGATKDQGIWTKFQDKEHPQVIIVQVQKGIGIELFRSNLAVFYSNSFSWIDYDQNLKRLDRNGQLRKINFIHMLADNTIDEDIHTSLLDKGSSAEDILNHMQHRRFSMAKDKSKKKDKKKPDPPKIEKPDHGVDQLAEALGVDPATARVKLRGVPALKKKYKTGRAWNFGSAKGVKEVAKQLASKKGKKD